MAPNDCYDSAGRCESGLCTYTPKAAGIPCDDDNVLTGPDQCDGVGLCLGYSIVCDAPPTPCHQSPGILGDDGLCTYFAAATGDRCDDGLLTTSDDRCDAFGLCIGVPVACDTAPDSCHESLGSI